jgi:hypothetical protein
MSVIADHPTKDNQNLYNQSTFELSTARLPFCWRGNTGAPSGQLSMTVTERPHGPLFGTSGLEPVQRFRAESAGDGAVVWR